MCDTPPSAGAEAPGNVWGVDVEGAAGILSATLDQKRAPLIALVTRGPYVPNL